MKCPLCQKECTQTEDLNPPNYACPTTAVYNNMVHSHFYRFPVGNYLDSMHYREIATVLPYRLINEYDNFNVGTVYEDEQEQQRIESKAYSMIQILKESMHFSMGDYAFVNVLETALIHMDTEEKLLARIKLLLLMS